MKTNNNPPGSVDLSFKVTEEPHPLIPQGDYSVIYSKHQRSKFCGTDKLYVYFKVADLGPYSGTELFKVYNYYSPLRNGSDLYKDLVRLYGIRVRKNTKLSMKLFKERVLKVRIRTVKQNRKQIQQPEHQWYSIVDSIIEVETSPNSGGHR